jgi:hypothetical protein
MPCGKLRLKPRLFLPLFAFFSGVLAFAFLKQFHTWYPQRSGLRYDFVATVEVVDRKSGKQIISTTSNLSRYGCYVRAATPFQQGARVKVTINEGTTFKVSKKVLKPS